MKNKFRQLIVLLLLGFAGLNTATAQFTETRQFKRSFKVSPETTIEISNKYGKIELNTWPKDSVVVQVKMLVDMKKASKLEKSLDNIDFDFANTAHYLVIRTLPDKNRTQLESEFLRFKESLLQNNGSIEINYQVWLPAGNPLKVENKFGDIYLDDYKGETTIDLSNGKLKAHNLTNKTTITLNFAGASVNSLPQGKINANYSDVYIKESGQLTVTSKSSAIELIENKSLRADSRRDKFRIKQTGRIDAEANFSNFRIENLTGRASMRLNYGDLELEKIGADFSDLYIDCRSTDINLYFSPESKFNFEISHTKSNLNLDESFTVSDKDEINQKEQTILLHGYFGKKTEGKEKLKLNATGGNVRLKTL
ncbi:hypothetical protein [Gaoshiqia sp. Z1-71]|uniref:hypothetical protein n=1 Tax=Gaoshiqia hydrogeniformans TaxID=3290090 RepID=UPI003BF79126